jgi:uncharacterized protein (TIGR03000 family)
MLRKILSVSLVLILAAAGLTLVAGASQAAPRGGGGFHGGGHFGGFHSAPQLGAFHGGSRPAFHSGFQGGRRPSARLDGRRAFRPDVRRPFIRTYPYAGDYGNYGGGLYSDDGAAYSNYPDYSDSGDDYGADVGGSGADFGQGSIAGLQTDPGTTIVPAASPQDGPAEVSMTLPADATLWAQGLQITGSGATREFHSPTLESGHRYTYDFQASWEENGHTVTQSQKVIVTAGAHVQVHFPVPPTKARTTP